MTDYVKQLTRLVPPPAAPFEAGDAALFRQVELKLGLELPPDYKELILTYGDGCWQQFWYVLNPFTQNDHLNLLKQSDPQQQWSMVDAERWLRDQQPDSYPPHPIYPEPGGILPWALTDNGGRFFWLTKGHPSDWSTVYYADRSPDFEVYQIPCAELVFKAVSGESGIFEGPFGDTFLYGQSDAFVPKKF